MDLVTPQSMRRMDREAIEEVGIPGPILMDRAARGAVDALVDHFQPPRGARIGILCGTGNNGGDGLAMATMLANLGFEPYVLLLGEGDKLSPDAGLYYEIAAQTVGSLAIAADDEELSRRLAAAPDCALWCDALLGTGLDRPLAGRYEQAVKFLRDQPAPVMAIDIPTGLDGRTGQVLGCAAPAQMTATFGFAKVGQCLDPARSYCGKIVVVDIGIPNSVRDHVGFDAVGLDRKWLGSHLPTRPDDLHKGGAGKTLHIGGRPETSGAIALSARAALVAGAGLITVATDRAVQPWIPAQTSEIMSRAAFDSAAAKIDKPTLVDAIERADTVVIGPGLGTDDLSKKIFEITIDAAPQRLIVDADALNLLAKHDQLRRTFCDLAGHSSAVLTPHPGEASRLLGSEIDSILADAVAAALELRDKFSATVVLKTAATVVAGTKGGVAINRTGNPGMATGGMGDALTGLVAAAFADCSGDAFRAACQAVVVHGLAGDRGVEKAGVRGLTVGRLLDAVPVVWQSVER